MRRLVAILLFVVIFAAGCTKATPVNVPIVTIEDNDPQLKVAIEKARETLPDFVRALNAPKPSQRGFAIKTPISDGKITEHMWLSPVTFDGTKYHGTVNNHPEKVTGVKLGSLRVIEPHQVTDWMYVEDKKLVGGFTIRVARDKLSPKERIEFERMTPFLFD